MERRLTSINSIARHAYIAIGLAVKTSRPQYDKERINVKAKLRKKMVLVDIVAIFQAGSEFLCCMKHNRSAV